MPLSEPAPRRLIHERVVECRGYARDDGLWDIEGRLVDTKTYDFPNIDRGGVIRSGEPIHGMWLRITVDDAYTIRDAEAALDYGPYTVCGDIAPAFSVLVGERIVPGFTRRVRELLGGTKGCTHLVELLGPIATTAFQTIAPMKWRTDPAARTKRPRSLNQCHAYRSDGPVVARDWPAFYTGGEDEAAGARNAKAGGGGQNAGRTRAKT